jgi:hypothetical protein
MEAIREIYRRLPRMATPDAKKASEALQEVDKVVDRFWKGPPCGADPFLAQIVRCAKDYIHELVEAEGVISKTDEETQHYLLLMLWFATSRLDLAANLLADEDDLSKKDIEALQLQWRNLGFPSEIREKMRALFREAPARSS